VPIPHQFAGTLSAPIIAAPMFLVSGPDLVVETCRAGMVGTFPSLNQRTNEGYDQWLTEIQSRLAAIHSESGQKPAPFGVNIVVHKSNSRLQADIATTIKHKVPLVITSLGAAKEVVDAVHSYGGLVFHDVINMKHARKAAEAGVDGLIAVASGAGGHAGVLSPFAMVSEIRQFFDKTIILSGVMSDGHEVAAARAMGADFAYLGTRFIATHEAMADQGFKEMSGVNANFLRPSIAAAGRDPDNLTVDANSALHLEGEAKVWKDIWSAGQGVGGIHDILSAADLCTRLAKEYREAIAKLAAELDQPHTPTA
jgi:nitronate monooxygenase